jgi:riboflavin biosynthesis pyrimidine reductase
MFNLELLASIPALSMLSTHLLWANFPLYETYRVRTLVCEGGPSLAKALAEIDAIDELFLTVAPLLFGGASAPGILGNPGTFLPSSRIYRLSSMNVESTECYLHYVADRR